MVLMKSCWLEGIGSIFLSRFVSVLSALKWMSLLFGGEREGRKVTLHGFIDVSLYASWINRVNYIFLMLLMFPKLLMFLMFGASQQPCVVDGALLWDPTACRCSGLAPSHSLAGAQRRCHSWLSALQVHALFFLTLMLCCVCGFCSVIRYPDIWFGAKKL